MSETPERTVLPQPEDGHPLSEAEFKEWSKQATMLLNQRRRLGTNGTSQAAAGDDRVTAAGVEVAAPPEEVSLQARLDELYSWRNEALAQLQDMLAQRKGVGPDARSVPPAMQPQVTRVARRLLVAASKNEVQIATLEGARRRWHASAAAAREAIRLRSQVAADAFGTAARPDAQAHLKLAHATFMLEGNSPRLRSELREAVKQIPRSQGLPYWLARYEIMAGNYHEAREAALRAADYANVKNVILPILDTSKTEAPQQAFPCNYYTYQNQLLDDDSLRHMQQALTELASDEGLREAFSAFLSEQDVELGVEQLQEAAQASVHAIRALILWNQGNRDYLRGKYASASLNYTECQREIIVYFAERYPQHKFSIPAPGEPTHNYLDQLALKLIRYDTQNTRHIWTHFRQRYMALTLPELFEHDWVRPKVMPEAFRFYEPLPDVGTGAGFGEALVLAMIRLGIKLEILKAFADHPDKVEEKVDAPLLALALVFTPLGIADSNRMRRNFDDALTQCSSLLQRHGTKKILCEFIEKPFVKILKAQILLDKADSQYKSRLLDESPEEDDEGNPRYQGLKAAKTYLGVLNEFLDQGQYVQRVSKGATILTEEVNTLLQRTFHPLLAADGGVPGAPPPPTKEELHRFKTLGKGITIPTIRAKGAALAGLDRRSGPHEGLLLFREPDSDLPAQEANPLIYEIITQAQARLIQLDSGFNYLGYRDDYIPPWRFQFLLERARYFVDHAKNAQREYLNFLGNAEREEFQELTAAQAVELEKSNIRIETARVEQTRLEVEASKLSQELAVLTANHAERRFTEYQKFDKFADEITNRGTVGGGLLDVRESLGSALGDFGTAVADIGIGLAGAFGFGGDDVSREIQEQITARQREFEKLNLQLAIGEAELSADIARAQLDAAQAGLIVAGLQRAAALLRHEFAVQSLSFLRNRTLNAEMWYRLAAMIREINNTYMRYAVELAFLAEQAYEFEADKRINVIRFDYDVSEVGSLLAADFLLRDLDTLEQDLIVNQRQRQQQARYILSLAREFPEALQELRDSGSTIFSLRLEQLERRFAGLFNIRIGAVEVTPVALMDPTRFSLEMTYLGASQVRLKAQPDTPPGVPSPSPLNDNDLEEQFLFDTPLKGFPDQLDNGVFSRALRAVFDRNGVGVSSEVTVTPVEPGFLWRIVDEGRNQIYLARNTGQVLVVQLVEDEWLFDIRDEWPVKMRITGPETTIFSGLTLQERTAIFPFISSSQRNAFEGLGAAAAWRIDMSMKENQVVPGTLVDLLITFNVSGYYDVNLRTAVDTARRRATELTQLLSAQQRFADAFYAFNHGGRMIWDVTSTMLSLDAPVRNLRNLGIILLPAPRRVQFSRLTSTYVVELDISADGQFTRLTPIPEVTFSINQLEVTAAVGGIGGADIAWDFGEGAGFQSDAQHTYNRPGEYEVGLRLVQDGRLYEYRAEIAVSRTQSLTVPLTAFPSFAPAPQGQAGILARANVQPNENVTIIWKVDQDAAERASEKLLDLSPGKHVVAFTAVRQLKAHITSQQRFVPDPALELDGLRISTNRVFELDGSETTGSGDNAPANALTEHLFPLDPTSNQRLALSPTDRWSLELSLDDNPFLRSVTSNDNVQVDLDEVEDAILILEYETGIG